MPLDALSDPQLVLAAYPVRFQPQTLTSLGGAGGFSGANLWRITAPAGEFCLRCWPPEHPQPDRLAFIHAVLVHATAAGIDFIPTPVATQQGATFVPRGERLWELSPWMPGEADFHERPTAERLTAALTALARFHRAVESFAGRPWGEQPSPTVTERRERIAGLVTVGFARLRRALPGAMWKGLAELAEPLLRLAEPMAPKIDRELAQVQSVRVPLAPCLRDVWHDHVLFTDNQVTGLIDFGSLRIESVATDLSRLLGSLVGDDRSQWQAGLAAYTKVRPLSLNEERLIGVFDRSSVLLSGLAWLEWAFIDERHFEDHTVIESRVRATLARLERLAQA